MYEKIASRRTRFCTARDGASKLVPLLLEYYGDRISAPTS